MSEKDTKTESSDTKPIELASDPKNDIKNLAENFEIRPVSSAETIKVKNAADENLAFAENDVSSINSDTAQPEEIDFLAGKSPAFRELAEPKLPQLSKENRARLQMQSPNRLYFYWTTKNNPFKILNRVFSHRAQNYTLVAKLINQTHNREEIFPISDEGSAWFDVDANAVYLVEVGFYAPQRPFIRLMFSNTVETPRKNPSPHQDFSVDWAISANQFAQVLDVSGYAHDAVEIALAGDDSQFAEVATRKALSQISGAEENDHSADDLSEIRFALLALASGYSLESLRGQISKRLFERLSEFVEKLSAENALKALQESFGEFSEEFSEENLGEPVFGSSSINFPRFSKRKTLPKFVPISSLKFTN